MKNSSQHDARPVPSSVWSSSKLSAVLAVALVVEILAIALYANYRLQTALDPDHLADRVEHAIAENYPQFRKELILHVKSEAPEIAEEVSQHVIAQAPHARQELEELTARQLERGLEEAIDLSADKFREILRANHADIVKVFQAIEEAPEETHQLVLDMEDDIERQLEVDLQRQAKQALTVHRQLNDKLQRLADPDARLEPKELLERRIVRILRTMQEQDARDGRLAERPQASQKY